MPFRVAYGHEHVRRTGNVLQHAFERRRAHVHDEAPLAADIERVRVYETEHLFVVLERVMLVFPQARPFRKPDSLFQGSDKLAVLRLADRMDQISVKDQFVLESHEIDGFDHRQLLR